MLQAQLLLTNTVCINVQHFSGCLPI